MAKLVIEIYWSYSQICLFLSSLTQPFNNWSERNYSQGFAWRPGSVSFRALVEEGYHQVNFFVNESVSTLPINCKRAFKVPFETPDGKIEVASISDSRLLEVPPGRYILQVEFLHHKEGDIPEINIRLNNGNCDFEIVKADSEIDKDSDLDLMAKPAT